MAYTVIFGMRGNRAPESAYKMYRTFNTKKDALDYVDTMDLRTEYDYCTIMYCFKSV